jgi:glycine/D-amino acid oxidase-like deaminating enzyme
LCAEIFYHFRVEGIDRSGEFWTVMSRGRTVSGDHLVTVAGGGTGPLGRSSAELRGRLPTRNGLTYFDTVDRGAGAILQVRKFSASRRAQAL